MWHYGHNCHKSQDTVTVTGVLVYKVDNLVQSSLLSSLVLTLIQGSFSWSTLKSWVCNNNSWKKRTIFVLRMIPEEVLTVEWQYWLGKFYSISSSL